MCEEQSLKKARKISKHECTVILLDVGSNMKRPVDGVLPALDYAKKVVDWILTRKIFSESPDKFVLIFFGSDETRNPFSNNENIVFFEEEMQTAKIDWLRILQNEVIPSTSAEGDFLTALIEGINFLRSSLESDTDEAIVGNNILLLSNLSSYSFGGEEQDLKTVDAIIHGITALHANFSVIGPAIHWDEDNDGEDHYGKTEKSVKADLTANETLLTEIVKRCKGISYSFDEALNMLNRFIPRNVVVRGQRFLFQIGTDVKLPLIFYKKVQFAEMDLKFKKFSASTCSEIKRESVFEKNEEGDEKIEGRTSPKSTFLTKDDIVKGYTFGSTVVPFNEADWKEYRWKKEIRSLSLIQFAKRTEILQHYLMDGSAYYCLPPSDDEVGCIAVSALVRALIEEDCIAIARYVYNAASFPRLLALFPRISTKGVDMFVGIQLPFYEDVRGLEFPPIGESSGTVKAEQSRAVEALISAMDLSKTHFDFETGEYGEAYRPKDVPNPKIQRLCEAVKFRALHPGEQLPEVDNAILTEFLTPQPRLLKLSSEPLSWMKKCFNLHEMKESKGFNENTNAFDEDSLFGFGRNVDTLPASGRFVTADSIKKEDL